MPILTFILAAMLIIIAAIMLILDMVGSADIIRSRYPRAWVAVTSRPTILLLLLIAITLLDRNYKDAMAVGPPPSVKIYAPSPPLLAIREPEPPHPSAQKSGKSVAQNQSGKENVQTGSITQGPCSNLQVGGANNIQAANCGPAPLILSPSSSTVLSDKEGLVKTVIRVVPNEAVAAPFNVVLKFDNPVKSVGFWVEGAGTVLGGGPASVTSGNNPVIPVGTGFNPKHGLLLTVYSDLPVRLIDIHLE